MIKLEKEQTARFAARLEQETQESVMRDIAQFSEADIVDTWASEPPACAEVHAMVFNMERGVHIDEAIEFLKDNPSLQPFDLILANELDFGTARSGEKNTAEEVAKALGLSYVFGLEFIELKDAALGFHGNAVFSRWPVKWAEVLRLPEQYNWYNDRQKRIGGLPEELLGPYACRDRELSRGHLGLYNVDTILIKYYGKGFGLYLENRTDGEGRRVQMQAVLDEVQRVFAGLPVILGGDLNTNTFDGRDKDYIRHLADHPAELADNIVKIDSFEPLLTACGDAGYAWRTASGLTRRKPVGEGNFLAMRLDWIIPRGFTAKDSRVISTVTADIDFAKEGGALARFAEPELSDHNVVWASLQLHK